MKYSLPCFRISHFLRLPRCRLFRDQYFFFKSDITFNNYWHYLYYDIYYLFYYNIMTCASAFLPINYVGQCDVIRIPLLQ